MNQKNIAYILIAYSVISFIFTVNENGIPLVLGSLGLLGFGLYLLYQVEPQFKTLLQSEKIGKLRDSLNLKGSNNQASNLPLTPLIASALILISTFLPWMGAKISSGSNSQKTDALGLFKYDESLMPIVIILLALAAAFLAYRKMKFALMTGVISIIIGIAYIAGWLGKGANAAGSYGAYGMEVEVSLVPQIGVYLLMAASLLYSITTFKFIRKPV